MGNMDRPVCGREVTCRVAQDVKELVKIYGRPLCVYPAPMSFEENGIGLMPHCHTILCTTAVASFQLLLVEARHCLRLSHSL